MDREFEEMLRLMRLVGTERFVDIQQRVWEAHPTVVADARRNGGPWGRQLFWREVLEALRLEVQH